MALFYGTDTYSRFPSMSSSSSRYPAQWLPFVKDIKTLYFSHLYKRCASQCERMLQDEADTLHPLHESCLHFYIAICNESLGLAAHRFSSKKLSYLQRAKDAFTASSVSLPLPYGLDNTGNSEAILSISQSSQVYHFGPIDDERSDVFRSAKLDVFSSSCASSDMKQSLHERCDSGYDSESESRSACSDNVPDFKRYSARQPLRDVISNEKSHFKSSSHAQDTTNINLHDGKLMPKPLFIKKRTSDLNQSSSASDQLPPTSTEPPYLSQCTTNISPPSNSDQINLIPTTRPASSSPATTPTPPLENQQPSTYNTNLQTFHTLLLNHLTAINHTIATTTHVQNEHTLNKTKRLASFWSFKPILPSAQGGANDDEDDDEEEEDVKAREKKERIELLRRDGWRVNKEKFGWKGEEHYEALRGVALGELS
ncbi:hypothetical protein EPUS_00381 [Endocarpon pusillum Z07020]|uniref:Uncharacterized protein n=1 Tax=Endocarpon pusillum (strain Z07020 / HMAS-L-300199) TaxID=1263415 RepID=U1GDQ3_ENDPU|nr:uncharacterized protein EPUS_00381 [Endocarpon pusillum Z07020]ERF70193.1 hypothetical protein EPUS_00381 [Endocarpon pusillum Z07020]